MIVEEYTCCVTSTIQWEDLAEEASNSRRAASHNWYSPILASLIIATIFSNV